MVLAKVQADCFRIPGKVQGQFVDSADSVRFRIRVIIRRVFIENSRDRLQGIRHISTETTPGQCFRITGRVSREDRFSVRVSTMTGPVGPAIS